MEESKNKILISIKKARGNLNRIERMIEKEEGCFAVIQQTLATIGLLKSANDKMLEEHIDQTLKNVFGKKSLKTRENLKKEIIRIIQSSRK
jgi:DNA-binding FrmR family transcriptional regulator